MYTYLLWPMYMYVTSLVQQLNCYHFCSTKTKTRIAWLTGILNIVFYTLALELTMKILSAPWQNTNDLFIAENGICSDGGTAIPGDSDQQPQPPNTPGDAYKRLDEDEKLKVRTIVYIMDRFSISLQGYHELTQVDKSLPRTHLVETCTKLMDSQWDIKRTPGTSQGAELPLKLLLEKEIRQHVSTSSCPNITFDPGFPLCIQWK